MPEGIVIGFDFGMRFTGVAVGDSITGHAKPLTILKVKDGTPRWEEIDKIFSEYQPISMVVGSPENLPKKDETIFFSARKFCRRLHGRYTIPTSQVDENFSSREAHLWLDAHQLKRKHTERIDDIAAAVLLEQYFREQQT